MARKMDMNNLISEKLKTGTWNAKGISGKELEMANVLGGGGYKCRF